MAVSYPFTRIDYATFHTHMWDWKWGGLTKARKNDTKNRSEIYRSKTGYVIMDRKVNIDTWRN